MKLLSYILLLASSELLGSHAVKITAEPEQKPKKSMISIDLSQTEYENDRADLGSEPLSDEMMMSLAQGVPQGTFTLMQKNMTSIDMTNLKNMGYEGEFWFGKPSQKMQVIFDTGSAWAWLFSEKCAAGNCPPQNKKYMQSKSANFHDNLQAGQVLKYGKGAILGHPSTDRGCFSADESHCVENLGFLTVVKSADL